MQPDLHCRTLAAHTLKHFRALSPLTHCMTNDVVQTFTANTLLALGASPAMVIDPAEARPFAAIANALLVNVGTLTASRADAMRAAVESAYDAKTPWTLDPVAVGALEFRRRFCTDLLSLRPAAIRGNASEIGVSRHGAGRTRRRYHRGGVGRTACGAGAGASDRLHRCGHRRGRLRHQRSAHAEHSRRRSVNDSHCRHWLRVVGGRCRQLRVTGRRAGQCRVGLLLDETGWRAAAERSEGPGSFIPAFLDALYHLDVEARQ